MVMPGNNESQMPIDIAVLCREIQPSNTILIFGAGSSIPSGGLSGAGLATAMAEHFKLQGYADLALADLAHLTEIQYGRRRIIEWMQTKLLKLEPTGGIKNLPMYDWKAIFTTNYDQIVEKCYSRTGRPFKVFSSDFDFGTDQIPGSALIYKLHGTIDRDRSLDNQSSMVITTEDYENFNKFRQGVFSAFLNTVTFGDVIIIGHSLADRDIEEIIKNAVERRKESSIPGKIYVLSFQRDDMRALLIERKGVTVCFGGIDEFFNNLSVAGPERSLFHVDPADVLGVAPGLRPCTIDVAHASVHDVSDPLKLFNGYAATFSDIDQGFTFARDVCKVIEANFTDEIFVDYILGPAGIGKTTAARQLLLDRSKKGHLTWEHKSDFEFYADEWIKIAKHCEARNCPASLFIDDAHQNLKGIGRLVDYLASTPKPKFRIVLASSLPLWAPRTKTPNLFKFGKEYIMSKLSNGEISRLLDLFDSKPAISKLVEPTFSGFSRSVRFKRLSDRCQADMFVCLKNIFSSERIDNIILREYMELPEFIQDLYRTISALEASNVRVHRQMIIRILNLSAQNIAGLLSMMDGMIEEREVNAKLGIYAWRGRHPVISDIILKYKFSSQEELFDLYTKVVTNINAVNNIEIMTANELCDTERGIGRIRSNEQQNFLYRSLISAVPSSPIPRHRLISNLIEMGQYETAENEVRVFERELRVDAPLYRFKASLLVSRSEQDDGISKEDRLVMLYDAVEIIERGSKRFPNSKTLYNTWCDIGVRIYKINKSSEAFDKALAALALAYKDCLDPEMSRMITRYTRKYEEAMW